MNSNKILLTLVAICLVKMANAQLPVLEKSYDISRKAKNGYFGGVEINQAKGTFDMIYVLKSSDRKIKRETYTFDNELNLINTVKDEEDIEKMRIKHKWFNYKGDVRITHSLTASASTTAKLVFRKKEITWKYRWLSGSYDKSVKQLEKVKPTSDNSEQYIFRGGSYEVKTDSTVLVIAGKQQKKNDYAGSMMHYQILSCDNNVNITPLAVIDFQYANMPIYSAPLDDDDAELDNDDNPRDWVVVFAPMGGSGTDKIKDPQTTNYTYLRLNTKGEILERFNFQSPTNGWRITGAYEHEGAVYMYGATNNKNAESKYINEVYKFAMVPTTSASDKEKEEASSGKSGSLSNMISMVGGTADMGVTQGQIDVFLDNLKYSNFQIGKISQGKFDFIKAPAIEEFQKLQEKPAGQKKFVEFDGKSFVINGISFSKSGDIFVNGQDFTTSKSKRSYKGVYMFQFANTGDLKRNYGVFLDQSKTSGFFTSAPLNSDNIATRSYMQESGDGNNLYWMMRMARSIHKDTYSYTSGLTNVTSSTWSPLYSMEYGSINIANNQLSDFHTLGDSEKKKFYLYPNISSTRLGNYSLFFSETEKGDKILLSRVDLSK
ncbi:MAG: hypothetical protein V4560_05400 [Bacteroidota bacterium]